MNTWRRLMGFLALLSGLACVMLLTASLGRARAAQPEALPAFQITIDQVVASGFSAPVQVTHAGDGSNRLFVVEQTGRIRVIKNGAVLAVPYLDLSSLIACCGERGLLGLAFHPNYAANGYFYVNYTRQSDGATVIARYRAPDPSADLANPASGTILLVIAQPYSNHNGGQLLFGPLDGYLYIGMGDGGSGGDPLDNAQNINTLLGAMLRLDVDGAAPYAVPPDNPYVGVDGLDELWAIGLRNPWRFSFDRLNGDLYIGDVGQNLWEEISFQAAGTPGGLNFGWRCKEASALYNFTPNCAALTLTDPIAEYSHAEGRSVTGGFVYRGLAYPALFGRYFYADFVEGKIWSLYKIDSHTWSTPVLELDSGINISAFGEDEYGELYVVDYAGSIRRLADVNGPTSSLSGSSKRAATPSADPGEVVTYTITLRNSGGLVDRAVALTDTIPAGLTYVPGSFAASHGLPDDSAAPLLSWAGNLLESPTITLTYQVTVTGLLTGSLVNKATLSLPPDPAIELWASLSVPRSVLATTAQDFIFPGTQPGQLAIEIPPSLDCDTCHSPPVYDRWRGSMMSQAGRDPLMWAALHVANIDAPGAGEYCLRCHTPKGWLEGRSQPPDGAALQPGDIHSGVACALCHRLVDPYPSVVDEAAAIDQAIRAALTNPIPLDFVGSSAMIVDPQDRRRGPFSFGLALPYHSAYQTDFLRQGGDTLTRGRMCGTCHNVYNPVLSWDAGLQQYWPNISDAPPPAYDREALFPVETTFDEWLYSDFARFGVYAPEFAGDKPDGIVRTCQDCHMRRSTGLAADPAFNPVSRDCLTTGCLPEHIFAGGNTWAPQLLQDPAWRLNALPDAVFLDAAALEAVSMLRRAATLTVTLTTSDTVKIADVRLVNHSGHKLPTGYPEGRQMWLHLQAFDPDGTLLYENGAYDWVENRLDRSDGARVYEVKQAMTPELAALVEKTPGASFHFVLNNLVVKDNRIPPRGYTQALYDQPGLRPVGAVYLDGQHWDEVRYLLPLATARVQVELYYQTASREYIDFLRANGGVDGYALGALWESSPSPPVVMAQAWSPGFTLYLPVVPNNPPAASSPWSLLWARLQAWARTFPGW